MKLTDAFENVSRVFLDTAPLIYYLERNTASVLTSNGASVSPSAHDGPLSPFGCLSSA